MSDLPTGTVTFLFTDLEGSTRLWEEHPDAMRAALARHDDILRGAVEAHSGQVVKSTGDGIHAVFATAGDAVEAALEAQHRLVHQEWGETGGLHVRMGLHTGIAESRGSDYFGSTLNRAARLMAAAHGGQVVCSAATADLAQDVLATVEFRDLGEHRLRDLSRPERVFQVCEPGLRAEFPVLRSLDALPGNLPTQRTNFIGREEELVKLAKLIDRSRVVTLTGVGGVGKTRLALQAAASQAARFESGTWFVDLGPVDDAGMVGAAVAAAMRLPDRRQGSAEDAIVASAADARALIVLDNCEHVIEAAARLAELITDRCHEVEIVATSREPLGIDGEQVLAVGPLGVPPPDGNSTPEDLMTSESVRLFMERASASRADFTVTEDNVAVVASVCRRLDGIPLAIELAAARTQSMNPRDILERLDERFRLLSHGRRTALGRHQTLRAAVDWSYNLLEPTEQRAFARLSVFAGGFTLDAAEAVVADERTDALDVVDTLGGLVAKSMVLVDEHAPTVPYRLLEMMREYAADRLEELDQPSRVADSHADYYVQLAERAATHIVGTDDSIWTRRLESEHDNFHVAMTWLRHRDPSKLTRLASGLLMFWHRQRHNREGLGWIVATLELDSAISVRARAELTAFAGYFAVGLSSVDYGNELLRQSLEASGGLEGGPSPRALMGLSVSALITNQPTEARRHVEKALAQARAMEQPFLEVECLSVCSVMLSMTSNDPRRLELADQAIEIARRLGNDYCLALALEAGGLARYRSDPAAAIEFLDECTTISTGAALAVHDQALLFKGIAHISQHEYGPAAEAFDAALAFHHATGAAYYEGTVLAAVAAFLARIGSMSAATQLLGSLEHLSDQGDLIGAPRDLALRVSLRDRLHQTMDGETFAEYWAAGRQLTLDDAVSLARTELSQVPSTD